MGTCSPLTPCDLGFKNCSNFLSLSFHPSQMGIMALPTSKGEWQNLLSQIIQYSTEHRASLQRSETVAWDSPGWWGQPGSVHCSRFSQAKTKMLSTWTKDSSHVGKSEEQTKMEEMSERRLSSQIFKEMNLIWNHRSSRRGSVIMNPTSIHEEAALAPFSGLRIQQCHELRCRSQMWLGSRVTVSSGVGWQLQLQFNLGTSMCCTCGPKKERKKEREKERKYKNSALGAASTFLWHLMPREHNVPGEQRKCTEQQDKLSESFSHSESRNRCLLHGPGRKRNIHPWEIHSRFRDPRYFWDNIDREWQSQQQMTMWYVERLRLRNKCFTRPSQLVFTTAF